MGDSMWQNLKNNNRIKYCENYKNIITKICLDDELIKDIELVITEQKAREECVLIVSTYTNNIHTLDYLINCFNINLNCTDAHGMNLLMYCCQENNNIEILKYLIETKNMNPRKHYTRSIEFIDLPQFEYWEDVNGKEDLLSFACKSNSLEIIKYLTKNIGLGEYRHYDSLGYILENAINFNPDANVIKYLIEKTDVGLRIFKYNFSNLYFFSLINENEKRFNELIKHIFNNVKTKKNVDKFIKEFNLQLTNTNYLMLNDENLKLLKRMNPFTEIAYSSFTELIDMMDSEIVIEKKTMQPLIKERELINFLKPSNRLFVNNEITYYGDSEIVYKKMTIFKDIDLDFSDPPILSIPLPSYLISMYLQSCYYNTGFLDFNLIKTNNDFLKFLDFIDQYPTVDLSIDSREIEIVLYMLKNKVAVNQHIKDLCKKYSLRHLYIFIKQKYYLPDN